MIRKHIATIYPTTNCKTLNHLIENLNVRVVFAYFSVVSREKLMHLFCDNLIVMVYFYIGK